ncbi:riboflavin synthase domain-like protein [Parathielavia hyrcaniae]|uniref:Riboflavin synthase domain-like protein n=1 Tax=Parathielavia hyrcaniae TaxID=113614 RepID=A0AAN6PXK8_9PEZI|nr:riboflavin synthase domain-like protein [Parathielavia hyrcaniae]
MVDQGGSGGLVRPAEVEGRSMVVLYGSETGTAEDIAVELGRVAERLHFQTTVDEMDTFKLADVLRASLVIFVTSTTGQGEMPKNTLKFWKNLRREKLNNTNCLRSLRFAIFGLGDSSYQKFNWAGRKLRARLLQLGATEFFRPGEGDERHENGIDSIYLPWHQELKATLLADYPLPESLSPIPDDVLLPPKYSLELAPTMQRELPTRLKASDMARSLHDDDESRFLGSRNKSAALSHVDHAPTQADRAYEHWIRHKASFPADIARRDAAFERDEPQRYDVLDRDNILKDDPEKYLLQPQPACLMESPPDYPLPIPEGHFARLVRHDRVTPADHWQDVRHLRLQVYVGEAIFREVVDHSSQLTIVLWPKNYPEDVQELIIQMGWEAHADTPLQLLSVPRALYVDKTRTPTLRHLLTHNLDFTAVPKRSFIRYLVHFTQDEREQERLVELTQTGNEQEFYDYTCRPRRTILELLRDFPGVKIPYGRVLDLFPVIRGREYSICNGGLSLSRAGSNHMLTVELLVALVEYKTIIRKPRQGLCSRYLKHLPVGTRLVVQLNAASGPRLVVNLPSMKRPMIAVATGTGIAPIRSLIEDRGRAAGDTLLFFGCRNRAADFHFAREWPAYPNVKVHAAFSRDSIEPDPATTTTSPAPSDTLAQSLELVYGAKDTVQYDSRKNYVQHLIRKHADEVGTLMRRNPIVCVCGNAGRMPISVRNAFLDALVLSKVVGNKEEAEKWLANPANLTFWQETW